MDKAVPETDKEPVGVVRIYSSYFFVQSHFLLVLSRLCDTIEVEYFAIIQGLRFRLEVRPTEPYAPFLCDLTLVFTISYASGAALDGIPFPYFNF